MALKQFKLIKPRFAAIILIAVVVLSIGSINVLAAPLSTYNYDAWDNEIPAPAGYTTQNVISGFDIGVGKLNNPTDIFVSTKNDIYISDTGNNRIVILDSTYHLKKIIGSVVINGQMQDLQNPCGLFVDGNGIIYVTQKELGRVLRMDSDGLVSQCYSKPDSTLLDENFEFLPTKVIKNTNNSLYVLSEGYFYGALTYDVNGEFIGFYGCNKVEVTIQVLADYAWKRFLSKEQKDKMTRYVPIAYSSFDIDSDNFVYTCTQTTKNSKNEIRKLNSSGNDIIDYYKKNVSLTSGDFGDIKKSWLMGKYTDTQFIDICVDADGLMYGLDYARGRIFQYDSQARLLNVFGGKGSHAGEFQTVSALDNFGDDILVLDSETCTFTVFSPTEYTTLLKKATLLYQQGLYEEAGPYWTQLVEQNAGCEAAYVGLGHALYTQNDYKGAMNAFKMGCDREGYSLAFTAQREIVIRSLFPVIATVIMVFLLALIIFLFVYTVVLKKKISKKVKLLTPNKRIFRSLTHPFDEFYDCKDTKSWSLPAAIIILLVWFIVQTISTTKSGFIFNYHKPEDTNLLYYFASTCLLFVLFVCVNWAITTLTDGKGKASEIFVACSYALIPYIASIAVNTILSNVFSADEAAFYGFVRVVGMIWSFIILIGALRAIHDFSFSKTLFCIFLTVLGMAFVIFLMVLFVSLCQQFISFAASVFNELLYRS